MATMEVRSPSFEKDADVAEVPVRKRWFPHADEFKLNDEEGSLKSREILEKLDSFLAAGRRKKIENVVENRTYTICLVLENLLEQGNITTVCNAADAFGFQSVHLISNCLKHRCLIIVDHMSSCLAQCSPKGSHGSCSFGVLKV